LKSERITLFSAINEYEPFQLVLRPKKRMENIRLEISPLRHSSGLVIPAENVSICHVEYVTVITPTDSYGAGGEWPDPLPPYQGPFTAHSGENHPLWITVNVPSGARPGTYEGTITLRCSTWKKEVPVRLNVWNFALSKETHIRSSFGLNTSFIKAYHNLDTKEELEKVADLYMENFREHRVCPTSPLDLHPMKVRISGVYWKGGEFTSEPVHAGKRALKVEDISVTTNVEAEYDERIPVEPGVSYKLAWFAKAENENQEYTVLFQCFNAEGEFLPAQNLLRIYKGQTGWKQETLEIKSFIPEVK